MTTAEAARFLRRRSTETIRRWARMGVLRSAGKLPNGEWLFRLADVQALVQGAPKASDASRKDMGAQTVAAHVSASLNRARQEMRQSDG